MAYNINLDEFSITLGISTDRLVANLSTYGVMSEIFPVLEVEGCKAGLFGDTALNKIYFGKKQRLSYDLDIFAYSYKNAIKILLDHGAKISYSGTFPKSKTIIATRMQYKNVILDVVDAKDLKENPKKLQAYDLLYFYNQLVPPVVVPSYTIDYLLAEKTAAMLDRNELKDIYDTWVGTRLLNNGDSYANYLKEIARKRKIKDIVAYSDFHIHNMLSNSEYYEKKHIEVLSQPSASIMLKDIKTYIHTLMET